MTRGLPPTMVSRLIGLAALGAMAPVLSACVSFSGSETATASDVGQLPRYELVRFWADASTPTFDAVVRKQFGQIRAVAGTRPDAPSITKSARIAISGGGADGAFAAGLMKGWTARGDRPNFEVVTGVSTGALAAVFVFLGPQWDPQLEEMYTAYSDSDIYASKGVFGLLGDSLYDTRPLRGLIEHYVDGALLDEIAAQYRLGRRLLIQTTDIEEQRPVIWDLSAIAASGRPSRRDLFVELLLASAAIPVAFPPVRVDVVVDGRRYDELNVDGGVTSQITFAPPNNRLEHWEREIFGHKREGVLYVIRNGRLRPQREPVDARALALATRSIDTLIKYQGLSNLRQFDRIATERHARLLYAAIPSTFAMVKHSDFDRDYMRALFAVGFDVGRSGHAFDQHPMPSPELSR